MSSSLISRIRTSLSVEGKPGKVYRIINIVIICFSLYMLALPLISPTMSKLFPTIWRCPSRTIFHRPCPFCGVTTDFGKINNGGNANLGNSQSSYIHTILILEIAIRAAIAAVFVKSKRIKLLMTTDALVHAIIIGYFILYVIKYFS
ncbi:MAG: hypothetical protein Q8930_07320 [Bacillota bacterium]|nr:hypothetical protein [Bacillota bacterium]